jgi:hypothetical protein
MPAPVIAPLAHARFDSWLALPQFDDAVLAADAVVFAVMRGGWFAGRRYSPGELLVCHGAPGVGDFVVVDAAVRGRPRLGSVERDGLRGDVGEPCGQRWQPVGRLVAVLDATSGAAHLPDEAAEALPGGVRWGARRRDGASWGFTIDSPGGNRRSGPRDAPASAVQGRLSRRLFENRTVSSPRRCAAEG